MIDAADTAPSPEAPTNRRRPRVRATALPHSAHVSAWARETARSRAVAQMFNDFDLTDTDEETHP